MDDSKNRLVSVVIVSYCAEDTIIQTLDSIYTQTYPNIELIISDDASPDNTVPVAQAWVDAHKERFANCIVLTAESNGGVAANLNRGISAATGYYVKDCAADDLLTPEYLSSHIAFCEENHCPCVFSNVQAFRMEGDKKVYIPYPDPADPTFFDMPAEKQYRRLLRGNCLLCPTFIATRELLLQNGLYDVRYSMMEDYPFYVKLTRQGIKLNYLDVKYVEYRQADTSISAMSNTRVLNPRFHKVMKKFFYKERLPELWKYKDIPYILLGIWQMFFGDCIIAFGNNRKSALVRFCEYMKELKFIYCLRRKNQ